MAAQYVGSFPATVATGVTSLTTAGIGVGIPAGSCGLAACRAGSPPSLSDSANGAWTALDAATSVTSFIFQNMQASSSATTLTGSATTSGTIRLAGDVFSGVAMSGQPLGHALNNNATAAASYTWPAIGGDPGGTVVWAAFSDSNTAGVTTATAGTNNGQAMTMTTSSVSANGVFALESQVSSPSGTDAPTMSFNIATDTLPALFTVVLSLPIGLLFIPRGLPIGV